MVSLDEDSCQVTDHVACGAILVDGLGVGDVGNIVLRDRKVLSQDGILTAVLAIDKESKEIISGPDIISRGFVYVKDSNDLLSEATTLIEHEVENVIIAGIGEDVKSESYCRKLSKTGVDGQEYADGSLYILYTQSGSEHDIKTISRNVVDYDTLSLEKGKDLADWESGVVNRQIDNISKGICEHTPAQVYSLIATHDMMDMYNLGANMGMYFMYKNREQTKVSVQGTYLNEYLISQPLYELTQGYIPLLFWQFVPPVSTIDRIKRDIQKVVDVYEKGALLENKTVHVNARVGKDELVQELKKRGFCSVTKRNDNVEELWDLSDGINSPCEEVVQNIVEQIGVKQYQTQCKNALYLNMGDLKLVTNNIPGLVFHSFKKK